jgi:hypothetical protein
MTLFTFAAVIISRFPIGVSAKILNSIFSPLVRGVVALINAPAVDILERLPLSSFSKLERPLYFQLIDALFALRCSLNSFFFTTEIIIPLQ